VSKELPVLQAGSSFDSDATGEFIWYQHADERERIMATYHNLTVAQIQAKRARGDVFHFIDVREPYEHAIAHIEGAELLPLSQANTWIDSRSAQVAAFLAGQRGFTNVANMLGGIEAWAIQIDPQVPRY
jgi:adenylyltransferase/sulfurtransferase